MEEAAKKRGRPAKDGSAKSGAERQREYAARQKQLTLVLTLIAARYANRKSLLKWRDSVQADDPLLLEAIDMVLKYVTDDVN